MSNVPLVPAYVRAPLAGYLGSLGVDRTLAPYDLAGSIAHAEMLGQVGILSPQEASTLVLGLRQLAREIREGSFPWRAELEDVHTNVEVRLTEVVGPVGGKLHTARSRNDQVALDERLFLRDAIHRVGTSLLELESTLIRRAEAELDTPMPGYTHLQRAQPITVGHWLLAHFWRFDRDLDRLLATVQRANVSPLGAGAVAGSTLPIDPERVAARLGFDQPFQNSVDAVSDRDPFAEFLFDLALLSVHASGLGEEVVLFVTKEFGFLDRASALGSGSSLMPQKRNPDAAELVRGQAGRVVGDLVSLLVTLKGLPLAYDRDLQEDKPPVWDALATVTSGLSALRSLVEGLVFDRSRLAEAAGDPELLATDVAEHLVARGVPFREAHEAVSAHFLATGGRLDPAGIGEIPGVDPSLATSLDVRSALLRRSTPGGPGPSAVAKQLESARSRSAARRDSLSSLGRKVGLVEELLNEG
ncbi:MAG: argininosuccinate lyase [Thermoplasmata archaeon]|nr:argininosuccinate lyase [Thermoplasmata archaeon]